jgi:hypothetical protein
MIPTGEVAAVVTIFTHGFWKEGKREAIRVAVASDDSVVTAAKRSDVEQESRTIR